MPAGPRAALQGLTADRAVLAGLIVLAAILRFVDLPTRGTWDADQGHDMLVLRGLVVNGEVPLLGPPTSIGDFHHGVLYYYLLAPAAAISGADPLGVVAAIALAGVVAVAVTWWLARSIGGPVAGAIAGLLMAVSGAAVDESTFIWNPNLIALSSSIALAAAWRAWSGGRARWWLVAALGAIVTMHCHVLGSILLPPIVGLWLADIRRREPGPERAARVRALAAGAVLLVVSYVPLTIHELQTDFSEIPGGARLPPRRRGTLLDGVAGPLPRRRPARARLAAGRPHHRRTDRRPPRGRAGHRPRWLASPGGDRPRASAGRWFAATLAWTIVGLTFLASGLATVIPGLPNDHYHAFADPVVFVVVGLGLAALARWRPGAPATSTDPRTSAAPPLGAAISAALIAALVVFNLTHQPPAEVADGGWPAARDAAQGSSRPPATARSSSSACRSSSPPMPSASRWWPPAQTIVASGGGAHVVICDNLFATAIGAACGGPAEDALAGHRALVDRFEAAPGRWISIYR